MRILALLSSFASFAAAVAPLRAAPPASPGSAAAHGDGTTASGPSPDAITAIKALQFDRGLHVAPFAAEPLLANPVSFAPDERGRWFITETHRQEKGVEDNRAHMDWLDDDIAARTVEDRLAMMRKFFPDPKKFSERFEQASERIVCVEDTNGDGIAEKSTVFADGFREALDGTAAGVIVRGKEVWFTCIPNLWRFEDTDHDGKADVRDKMLSGFGVKFAFRGHDMHGLRFGPDGKLYFSIGDRGLNVKSKEGAQIEEIESGTILRCNPDGTGFEIFATGVRNPQELAFNEYGDLFTGDNNSDGGDKARFLHLVEGGDYGWRMAYQYLNDRGPWNREKLWDDDHAAEVKYIVPPIANIGNGPSGLTYAPGTGLSAKYNGSFFMSDFRGGASASVVHRIRLELSGAGYRLKERDDFLKGLLTTDVEFGPDGGLYLLDWVEGWSGVNKGRIYKVTAEDADQTAQRDVQKLLAEGMARRTDEELAKLLGHADQRVRLAAQMTLAAKGSGTAPLLAKSAQGGPNQLARLHGIWGLGQVAEKNVNAAAPLIGLLGDGDAEVRAQSAKVLGERRVSSAGEKLIPLLGDRSARVGFHAAVALGKLRFRPAFDALCGLLAENADKDPILRHGAVLGLVGAASVEQLAEKKNDGRVPVRIGAVFALRRQVSPLVAEFLKDPEEAVVLEAARAIHDQPITAAFPALADLVKGDACKNLRVLERAVNANYRLGQPRHAQALAQFSTNAAIPEAARRDALEALADWAKPSPKDRVLNQWRPIASRDAQHAAGAVMPVLGVLLADHGGAVQETAAHLARRLSLKGAGQSLATVAKDETARAGARIAALRALAAFKDERLLDAARCAMSAKDDKLRSEGLKALAAFDPASAAKAIAEVIERGSLREKQGGIVALTQIDRPEARTIISELMDKLMAGQCPPEIQLDVYEASKKVGMTDRAQQFKAALPQDDPLANYKLSLAGGDADRGRKIFREKVEVQCLRCHKCEIGDSLVGPDLTKIASEKDRLYLLESIIFPNAHIAQGFQIVTLTMKDNQMIAGRLLNEGAGQLTIETMDEQGKPKAAIVAADQIKERLSAPSPMPENIRDQLSRWELRDLVEYLATRK